MPSEVMDHHGPSVELFTQLPKHPSEYQATFCILMFLTMSIIFSTTLRSLPLLQICIQGALHRSLELLGFQAFHFFSELWLYSTLFSFARGFFLVFAVSSCFDEVVQFLTSFDVWENQKRFLHLLGEFVLGLADVFSFSEWFRQHVRFILYKDRRRVFLYWTPDKLIERKTARSSGPTNGPPETADQAAHSTERRLDGYQFVNAVASSEVIDTYSRNMVEISRGMELVNSIYRAYFGDFEAKTACLWRFVNYLLESFPKSVGCVITKVSNIFRSIFSVLKLPKAPVATSFLSQAADFIDHNLNWVCGYSGWYSAFSRLVMHFVTLPIIGAESLMQHTWFEQLICKKTIESIQRTPAMERVQDFVSVISDFLRVLDSAFHPDDEDARFLASISSISGWCTEVQHLENMVGSRSHSPGPNVITFDEFNKRVVACEALRFKFSTVRGPFTAIVTETRRRLDGIAKAQRMVTALNSEKPFVVALTGIPGVGKTELVRHIVRYILRKRPEFQHLTKDDLNAMLFSVIPSKNFVYENYNPEKHYAVFFDEVGTILTPNSPIHPSILSVMEHGTHVLEQASVEKKGVVLFKSKLIIINNNSVHFGLDKEPKETGIYNKGAWFRRIDCHLDCRSLSGLFRKEDGGFGPRAGAPNTLAIGLWRLMSFENNLPYPVEVEGYGNEPFPFNKALDILRSRYEDYMVKCATYRGLDDEDLLFFACTNNEDDFNCECCSRCPLCSKTERCVLPPHNVPCSDICKWSVEDRELATKATAHEDTFNVDVPLWQTYLTVFLTTGTVGFFMLLLSGAPFLYWGPVRFGALLSFSFAASMFDHRLADRIELKVWNLLDACYTPMCEFFKLDPLTYVRFSCVILASSLGVFFLGVNVLTFVFAYFTGSLPSLFWGGFLYLVYGLAAWRQFFRVRLAKYLPEAFKVAKERFRTKYGVDPDSVGAACLMFLSFLSGYAIWRKFGVIEDQMEKALDDKDEDSDLLESDSNLKVVESTASAQHLSVATKCQFSDDASALSHINPILDVHASRNPWDDGRKVITFSESRIPLDALIDRCKDNQVRMEVMYRKEGSLKRERVGGTALFGSFLLTSYHSVRCLARESSSLEVYRCINGSLTPIASHTYTTGMESVLRDETLHVDDTGDVVLLNVKNSQWKDLSRFVVVGCNLTDRHSFPAAIVYQEFDGETRSQKGVARWTHHEVQHSSGSKLYSAWYYLFTPDDKDFSTFSGICGGVMLATNGAGDCAGIVGVLSIGATLIDDDGNTVFMAGALPINQSKVSAARSSYTRAVPTSRPDGFPLELEDAFSNSKSHCHYATGTDIQVRYAGTEVLGFREDARTFPSSRVAFYGWEKDVFEAFPDLQHDYVPPRFRGTHGGDGEYYHPGKHAISDLSSVCSHFSLVYHQAAYLQLVKDKMRSEHLASLYAIIPFSSDPSPSLSGIPASMIHQGIKRNTAAGYPWKGKKHNHLVINPDETVTPTEELSQAVQSLLSVMSEGRREWLVTRGAYKDEPRSKDKVAIRKIRLFNPPDMAHYVVEHLVLSPLIQISLLSRGSFHTLGGMNVYSEEWSKIRENLEPRFPHTIPGDFSKFDKGTSFSSMFLTSESDLEFIRTGPYYKGLDPQHQQAFDNIFISLATAMGDVALAVDGEFLAPGHGNGSGSADTYKKNCEVHALIAYECVLVIVYDVFRHGTDSKALSGSLAPQRAYELACSLFRGYSTAEERLARILEDIVFIKHGDDGLYCVTEDFVPLFNFAAFQYGYSLMGVKYTPSDKSNATFSHKSWDDVDIGKRRWLWNDELSTYLAPLDKSSIGKMLTLGLIVSQSVAEKRQVGVEDALREFAQYGREEFEKRRERLSQLCDKWDVPFPAQKDWKEVVVGLRRSREYAVIGDDETLVQAAESAVRTEISHLSSTSTTGQAPDEATVLNTTLSADDTPLSSEKEETHATMDSTTTAGAHLHSVATSDNDDPNHQEKVQSSSNPSSENVSFVDASPTYSLDLPSGQDSTFTETDAQDSGFEGFLDRYIELTAVEWTIGSDLLTTLDVWKLWRENARIAEKLKHFRYLRMDMEVRFVINGTPFHYGQIMAAYAPMLNYWGKDFATGATATAQRAKSSLYNFRHYCSANATILKETTDSYFSTFPHVMIMPGENKPVTLELPFIWHNNALRVNKTDQANSDGTTSMESPGSVVLTDLIGLGRASDTASNKIEVSVWARAKNVSLNTPTAAVATSEVSAAQDSGFVSKMASSVAGAAKTAGKVPVLAPYAKATEVAAGTLGKVATLFGFSRPANPSPAENYGLVNARNIAATNISDNSQKLTFDVNQEISVDSRVIGSDGTDEMSFSSIVKRWWWCGKAPWTPSSASGAATSFGFNATDTKLLYRSLVSPIQYRHEQTVHTTAREAWHLSPAGYLANTFRHWRGSFSYRIQVVASPYHKGRLKIQFDPFSGSATSDYVEARYTWILDLTEAREIEVTIPYTSYRAYLDVADLANVSTQDPHYSDTLTATTTSNFDENNHMGFLSISVVNDLVAPNGVNGKVFVSVWSRMEDDAEFQVPATEWHNRIVQATGTSAEETVEEGEEEVIGASANPLPMWSIMESPDRTHVFFGERVLSIRALLKRFIYVASVGNRTPNKARLIKRVTIPHWQPPSVSGQSRKNNYQMYFSPAFLARRGSNRFKLFDWIGTNTGVTDTLDDKIVNSATSVERKRDASGYTGESYAVSLLNAGQADNDTAFNRHVSSGAAGGAVLGRSLGADLIEIESPYYKPARFDLAVWTEASLTPIETGSDYIRITGERLNNDNQTYHTGYYAAGGEDIALMFFLAAPVLYSS